MRPWGRRLFGPAMPLLVALRQLAAAAVAVAFTMPALALQITDDRGVTVTFVQSPQRIVSLLPSLTETVCELGRCARLVGVDRYSNYPASVKTLPPLGGGLDPNIEAVLALRPDMVLMATSSRAAGRLESLGLKVVALDSKSSQDAQRVLEALGKVLEVPDAQRIWRAVDAAVKAAAQSLPDSAKGMRVYFEVSNAPHGAGEASFIGQMLTRMGVKNIIPAAMGPFPKLNPEFVVRANPELIMVSERSGSSMAQRPGWARIRAIREHRVCEFSADQSDVLVRPGPRMAEGARLMAQCLTEKSR